MATPALPPLLPVNPPSLSASASESTLSVPTSNNSMDTAIKTSSPKDYSNPYYKKMESAADEEMKIAKDTVSKMQEVDMWKPPVLKDAPDPKQFQHDPMQTMGGALSFLAMFGSMLTKHPMTTALNSLSGMMQAQKSGDETAYKQAVEKAKTDNDNAIKMAEWQKDVYKELLKRPLEEAKIILQAQGDQVAVAQLEAGNFDKHVDTFERNLTKYKKGADEALIGDIDWSKMKENDVVPGTGGMTFGAVKTNADAMARGVKLSTLGLGYSMNPKKLAVENYFAYAHPNIDLGKAQQDYYTATQALNAFGKGKQGDTVRSFNVAFSHAELVGELADALENGDVPAFNAAAQKIAQETGSAAPTNFEAAKNIFADEVNKAAVGSAGALADREKIQENIKKSSSPAQLKGQVETFKKLIAGQMVGIGHQYKQATKRDDFEVLLLPNVEEAYKNEMKKINKTKNKESSSLGTKDNPIIPETQKDIDDAPEGSFILIGKELMQK